MLPDAGAEPDGDTGRRGSSPRTPLGGAKEKTMTGVAPSLCTAVAVLSFAIFSGPPVDAATSCTINGSPADETLQGTRGADVICGHGGDDMILGAGGDDVLLGGRGNDVLRGGFGWDYLSGKRGADRFLGHRGGDCILSKDGRSEHVSGGRGHDYAKADTARVDATTPDVLVSVEHVGDVCATRPIP
jgi:hemolysin type calcium-binding protein